MAAVSLCPGRRESRVTGRKCHGKSAGDRLNDSGFFVIEPALPVGRGSYPDGFPESGAEGAFRAPAGVDGDILDGFLRRSEQKFRVGKTRVDQILMRRYAGLLAEDPRKVIGTDGSVSGKVLQRDWEAESSTDVSHCRRNGFPCWNTLPDFGSAREDRVQD